MDDKKWTKKKLGDLLTEDQIQRVADILNSDIDDIQRVAELKLYLGQFREQLESKQVLPEYLAYALVHEAGKMKGNN